MKVIKVCAVKNNKLLSTFASGKWRKEYAIGVPTTPDVGFLFAFPDTKQGRRDARKDMGVINTHYLADAVVTGKMSAPVALFQIGNGSRKWEGFWGSFIPGTGGEYVLCSSITLLERITRLNS